MRLLAPALAVLAFAARPAFAAPDTAILAPAQTYLTTLTAISGTATDATRVSNVQIRLKDLNTGFYWDNTAFPVAGFAPLPDSAPQTWFDATATDGAFDSVSENWKNDSLVTALTGMEGHFLLEAKAIDGSSVEDPTPASINFFIDNSPPLSSVDLPAHGTHRLTLVTLSGAQADFVTAVTTVQVRVQDMTTGKYWNGAAAFQAAQFWSTATLAGPFWSESFGAALSYGTTYQVVSKAFDAAGNVQTVFDVGFASNSFVADDSPPSTASVTGLFVDSATANWALVYGSTGYVLLAALNTTNPPPVIESARTVNGETNTTGTLPGLTPNTTYSFFVKAAGPGVPDTAYYMFQTSATATNEPTSPAAAGVTNGSANLSWNANSNPGGTLYTAEAALTSGFTAIAASSTTLNTAATLPGLNPNTTYFMRVKAVSHGGTSSSYSTTVSSATDPNTPASLVATADSNSQVTLSWGANSNPGGTLYLAEAAADSGFSAIAASSSTRNTSGALTGLSGNTTYYLRVKAVGHNGSSSAYSVTASTITGPNTPGTPVAAGVTNASVSVSWGLNGNPAGTQFTAQAAADSGFTAVAASSTTLNTSATLPALSANTTYFVRVKAIGSAGTPSAYSASVSTATDANAPVTPVATPDSGSRITLTWGANSNPAGTRYTAQLSTASNFTGTLTSAQATATSASFTSLTAATTYYLRVKANGHNGSDSAYSATASTVTAATPPDTLSGTVKTSAGAGINLVPVLVYVGSAQVGSATTGADGAWSVTGLQTGASNKVVATYTYNNVSSQIYQEGHTTGESGIDLRVEINVTLGSVYGTLRLAAAGLRPAGRYATASAATGAAYVEVYQNGRKLGTAPVDGQGRFEIPNLLPGRYALRSFDGAAFGEMTEVTVAAGQRQAVSFAEELLPPDKVYFYPNPAHDHAVIRFESSVASLQAQASVFDLTGALVREFDGADAAHSGAEVSWTWDLTNSRGQAVASGVYLVQVKVVDAAAGRRAVVTKKLAVVR